MTDLPAPDPFALLGAAAAHMAAQDLDEVEVEYWQDGPDGTPERRLTVTLRSIAAIGVREHGASYLQAWNVHADAPAPEPTAAAWVDSVQEFADGQHWTPPADEGPADG